MVFGSFKRGGGDDACFRRFVQYSLAERISVRVGLFEEVVLWRVDE